MIRVLIADDSRVMRQIVIRTLRQAGYDWDVREAADGAQALAAVRADEPDVVLSDWNMPEMNGIDLLRSLRAEGFSTPFGFVTSEGSDEMRELAEREGALFLIVKPFTAETFRDAIEPVLA
ncbi:response regulator [Cellulomonas sp. JZ18]|uniref:response regulator n=1 Tax=Cellulomonas sp. JZ18 TaxID=2654191 RepID=UPI001E57BAD5|nr:response regulator [Cellulomonas sp. JZ18]